MQISGRMRDILMDPDLMKQYNELIKQKPGSDRAYELFSTLFGQSLLKIQNKYNEENNAGTFVGGERSEEEIIKETMDGNVAPSREIEPVSQNLSQQPINVAQMQPQTQRSVASGSVTDKQQTLQGLASLGMNYFS